MTTANTTTKPNSYLVFCAATVAIRFDLDETARVLLNHVGIHATLYNSPLTVTQAMDMPYIASPATMHRKVDDLLKAGYITLEYGDNRRTKFLTPTAKAQAYFDSLSVAIDSIRENIHE